MAQNTRSASLKDLLTRPSDRAPVITISGEPGVGKTTLACLFPKPVVLRLEDGLESIPAAQRPYSFPLVHSLNEALEYVRQLGAEESPFKTLIVDSVSKLGTLIEAEVIAGSQNPTNNINNADGGYGAGLNHAAELHRVFAEACTSLVEYGIAVVFVAHSVIENVTPPDGPEYTRYALRLDKRSQRPYVDDVDMVAFVRLRTRYTTSSKESAKAKVSTDMARVIVTYPTGAHISKNRYGIEDTIVWTDKTANPLITYIPFFNNHHDTKRTTRKAASTKEK